MLAPMALRRPLPLLVLATLLSAGTSAVHGPAGAQEAPPPPVDAAGKPTDASTPAYLEALDLQRRGRYQAAQKAFWKILEEHPQSVHLREIWLRSGWDDTENHLAGVEVLHESGPAARRIDVSVMGDGFTVAAKDQRLERDWAELCLEVLWSEASFDVYRDYFNVYFVRLVSEDKKINPQLTDAQKARIEEKNKRRAKKRKYDYETALDCKEAGPQGQVMADRDKVFHWLGAAAMDVPGCADDGLVIAFARFGKLGIGGGGVANVGRPDKSITVHEFGHAFAGLLDEYAVNPNPPMWAVRAANATSDPEDVPWQHFLDAKVKGVEVIEGGATFVKGVWRPARTCAMNAAGATGYCPVCREANVLAIYRYVSPIDTVSPPPETELRVTQGDDTLLVVTPMQPRGHEIAVTWTVEPVAADAPGPAAAGGGGETLDLPWMRGGPRWNRGDRHREDRSALDEPPAGAPSDLGGRARTKRGEPVRHELAAGRLPPGRYTVTATAKDPTEWVLRDPNHLLEERRTWWVTVLPAE